MDLDRLRELDDVISGAADAHMARCRDRVSLLISEVKAVYAQEVDSVLPFLVRDARIAPITAPSHGVLKGYLLSKSETGDELCHFGPPLSISPGEDFALPMIVYAAMSMAYEGVDTKGGKRAIGKESYYDFLISEKFGKREASALNSMLSIAIMNSAICRLVEKGLRELAETMLKLTSQVAAGMTAEKIPSESLTFELYRRVTERNAIAREMVLDQAFMRTLPPDIRSKLLSLSARLFEVRKMVDDLGSGSNSRISGPLDFLKMPEVNRQSFMDYIETSLEELWNGSCRLHPELRDVMALRMGGCLKMAIKKAESWTSTP